jgi:hypothetical protein
MSTLRSTLFLGAVVVGVSVIGCGGGDPAGGDPKRSAAQAAMSPGSAAISSKLYRGAPFRSCRSHVESESGPPSGPGDGDLAIGPGYFAKFWDNAQNATPSGGRRYLGVKVLFALRAGAQATLVVPPVSREHIGLQYGHSVPHADPPPGYNGPFTVRNGGVAVRFEGCPSDMPAASRPGAIGAWTEFSGGFFVDAPGCYPVELHVADGRESYRVGLPFGNAVCSSG